MKLWGGRFTKEENEAANEFNASIKFDKELYKQDIKGSIAHSKMLAKCNIISEDMQKKIQRGLEDIEADVSVNKIEFSMDKEDIHMNIESLLTERIGEGGKILHTARSRNDQVALDLKMYIREQFVEIKELLSAIMQTIFEVSEKHKNTLMPGYTHMQRAQPITFGFHMMAYFQMFKRDYKRMENAMDIMDEMPLGACALSGTSYETDRRFLAEELSFSGVTENSMDSVSDRDFAMEFLFVMSVIGIHLSRLSEELILWSSKEFDFIEIDDALATGSSIMPQKKNPDMAELIRGKCGRLNGNLIALLTVMKGLPLAYNKDLQEDKEPVFDSSDTIKKSISIMNMMMQTMRINEDKMHEACKTGFLNATDAADYLVKKGVPFRECHEIIGKIVLYCIKENKCMEEMKLEEYRSFSKVFAEDIYDEISMEKCVKRKNSEGGTGAAAMLIQLEKAKAFLESIN